MAAPRPPPDRTKKHARGVPHGGAWGEPRRDPGLGALRRARKAPFDGASRPQLAALFKRHGGPPPLEAELAPEESGLPRRPEWEGVDVAVARALGA